MIIQIDPTLSKPKPINHHHPNLPKTMPPPPPNLPTHKRTPPPSTPLPANKRRRHPHPPSGKPTPHGSYKRYYERRFSGQSPSSDPRLIPILSAIKKLRISSPTLLDIGCNDGALTIAIAAATPLDTVLGVDIDRGLVDRARNSVRRHGAVAAGGSNGRVEMVGGKGKVKGEGRCEDVGGDVEATGGSGRKFPWNVSFRREDFAAVQPGRIVERRAAFDVVLCLSVTKWVHLDGGDDALKRLFKRIYDCLRPGGVLVLEPQPRISYKRARRKGMGTRTFREMKLRPDMFGEYLLGPEIGFVRADVLSEVREGKGKAFNRPIIAFYKADDDCRMDDGEKRAVGASRDGTNIVIDLTDEVASEDDQSDKTGAGIAWAMVAEVLAEVEKGFTANGDGGTAEKKEEVTVRKEVERVKGELGESKRQLLTEATMEDANTMTDKQASANGEDYANMELVETKSEHAIEVKIEQDTKGKTQEDVNAMKDDDVKQMTSPN